VTGYPYIDEGKDEGNLFVSERRIINIKRKAFRKAFCNLEVNGILGRG
jgi:hypothetical protein